jgi:hypothetical protein
MDCLEVTYQENKDHQEHVDVVEAQVADSHAEDQAGHDEVDCKLAER